MSVATYILVLILIGFSAANTYLWVKAEDGTIQELGYMIRSFGFAILAGII